MPIDDIWWSLTREMVATENDIGGVYELSEDHRGDTPIYVGSSVKVKERLERHRNTTDPCLRAATHYRIEYTPDYENRERELYDEHVRIHGLPPRCNDVRPPGRR